MHLDQYYYLCQTENFDPILTKKHFWVLDTYCAISQNRAKSTFLELVMFQKVQIQTSDTLQVYHGEYRGIFENVEFWAASSALQAKNGQNLGIIWMYSQWLQLLGSFNLIQADANLRERPWKPLSHFSIRANEGDMNSLTVVTVNIYPYGLIPLKKSFAYME